MPAFQNAKGAQHVDATLAIEVSSDERQRGAVCLLRWQMQVLQARADHSRRSGRRAMANQERPELEAATRAQKCHIGETKRSVHQPVAAHRYQTLLDGIGVSDVLNAGRWLSQQRFGVGDVARWWSRWASGLKSKMRMFGHSLLDDGWMLRA